MFIDVDVFMAGSADFYLLDVREKTKFERLHFPGAMHVHLASFNDRNSHKSSILKNFEGLKAALKEEGLVWQGPIIIVGNSTAGWGEEGRLYWILKNLGFEGVKILDGGFRALKKMRDSWSESPLKSEETRHKFEPEKKPNFLELQALETIKKGQFIDVRNLMEFAGATPFGSSWGGHIDGAKSLPWTQLFDFRGKLANDAREKLEGLTRGRQPIFYCTAGYRSAMVYAVADHFGIQSLNYDGSWYEYSHLNPKKK